MPHANSTKSQSLSRIIDHLLARVRDVVDVRAFALVPISVNEKNDDVYARALDAARH